MSGEYFVLQVSEDGIPGKLEGPVDWDTGIQRVLAITAKHEPVTDEVREAVDMDGSWSYQDGGGVYIVQSEPVTGRQIGRRAKEWQKGRDDRLAGQPCRSANGAYLEGWYSVE